LIEKPASERTEMYRADTVNGNGGIIGGPMFSAEKIHHEGTPNDRLNQQFFDPFVESKFLTNGVRKSLWISR